MQQNDMPMKIQSTGVPVSVLVVEDDAVLNASLCSLLASLGYTVAGSAYDGLDAVQMTEELRPTLVLMDARMPDPLTGKEDPLAGIKATRRIVTAAPLPVILLTAHESSDLIRQACEAGVSAYLLKPVSRTELERTIHISLARFEDFCKLHTSNQQLQWEIMERRRIEQAERQQRALAEALRDTAAALTSTLQLDEVLDRILENVGKVVPHDAVNIMLVEGNQARVVSSRGYEKFGARDQVTAMQYDISTLPNLRQMAYTGRPLVVANTVRANKWVNLSNGYFLRSYAGAPICIRENLLGFLNLDSATPGYFTLENAENLMAFANQAAVAIENAHLYAEVKNLSIIDSLTGVYNRRALADLGRREIERAARFNRPLSSIFLDIDFFKLFNDRYSHMIGDLVLHEVAQLCQEVVRDTDLVARYGGEEFVILLPETALDGALMVADRLREQVADTVIQTSAGDLTITISLGVHQADLQHDDLSRLISAADEAMLAAKRSGRNRVEVK